MYEAFGGGYASVVLGRPGETERIGERIFGVVQSGARLGPRWVGGSKAHTDIVWNSTEEEYVGCC